MNGSPLTFHAEAGKTYYFQAGMENGSGYPSAMQFHVEVTPPPEANFYYNPSNPSVFDTIAFSDLSSDPGEAGFQSFTWNFGDGTIATGGSAYHQYAKDGDYAVQHSVTTVDGRTDSTSQIIQVRTHDVGITKVTAPKSASTGQTKSITVAIRNSHYAETVTVELYKSTPGGDVQIGSLTLQVPVLAGSKTKLFTFNYTFTSQDAQVGKVTFRAVATINGPPDAFPADNTGISSPPTKVTR
jgi:PKD repeat protein